jgi:hypothetical protein
MDNFKKWHVIEMDTCCPCKRNGESVDHLILHCDLVYVILSFSVVLSCLR